MTEVKMMTYFVTYEPGRDGQHVVHSERCRVLIRGETDEVGAFADSAAAVRLVQALYDPVIACPICCGAGQPRARLAVAEAQGG
jgi:hypothetical protein